MTLEIVQVVNRPAGSQPIDLPIVQAAAECYRSFGNEPSFVSASSTDTNVPIALGIPGLAIGGGGSGRGAHSLAEEFDPAGMEDGIYELFMLTGALLGVEGVCDPLLAVREK